MPDSSRDNLPIADEPTRDFTGSVDDDSMDFDESLGTGSLGTDPAFPKQLGDYAIKSVIGSGGMGKVYLAEHIRMHRTVAVKVLKDERISDEASIDRFYEEVRAASRLLHPNIVAAFDAGESEGIHYLAMEYVDGMTLTEIVVQGGPLSVGEAASVIRQAALGLLHAHRSGIVHRDIKPSNLMRAADGTIKVLDLGLAQISSSRLIESESGQEFADADNSKQGDNQGRLIGTLAYMSPEQLESPDAADPRSDIYSLGALLYFLLTARPPFVGEYLDQVYGHRHGEIPDLMQVRDDVDLNFANIFRRMMAKKPSQRYASLDEVIEDLTGYTDTANAPLWLAEFTRRQTGGEGSTFGGGSTSGVSDEVLAIDLGMFYSAAASSSPAGSVAQLSAGGVVSDTDDNTDETQKRSLFRMAMANSQDKVLYGVDAIELRASEPRHVVHCLPMYIGKEFVDREFCGQQCPPEVLLAMMLKRIVANSWPHQSAPRFCAITVPASYDQLHRQSVLRAAEIAGLQSVRLVDRSVAATQTLLIDYEPDHSSAAGDSGLSNTSVAVDEHLVLYIGLTGQGAEVSVIRRDDSRLQQLFSSGHWHTGSLAWLHRLVDLVSETFLEQHNVDPRKSMKTASALQIACEKALNSLLLMPNATVAINIEDKSQSVSIQRSDWLERSEDLIESMRKNIHDACKGAGIGIEDIEVCVTSGPLMRLAEVRSALLGNHDVLSDHTSGTIIPVDRTDVARGAASCLAAELPGRGDAVMPPHCVTGQAIGILVEDARGRRRILPIIPRGTALPARTNRRLKVGKKLESMTLSLVESSGVHGDDWHVLGRYVFEIDKNVSTVRRSRMIGFELNANGLLRCRAQTPGTPGSTRLHDLPESTISEEEIKRWMIWIAEHRS